MTRNQSRFDGKKNLLFKKKRATLLPKRHRSRLFAFASSSAQPGKKKKKKKERKRKIEGWRFINIFLYVIQNRRGYIFTSTRYLLVSSEISRWGGKSVSWSVGKEIGARHFLLEPRARIRSVYRMQIDRLGRSGGRESGSSPSGRTTERRS